MVPGKTLCECCCPSHGNASCFCSSVLIGIEKNEFRRSLATYYVPAALLYCSIKDATSVQLGLLLG